MARPEATAIPAKAVIASRGLRQMDVARSIGAKQALFNLVLNGRRRGNPDLRAKLSRLLNMPEADLFGANAERAA